ncbi:MAG TPA: hypothetical protein DGG95_15965 [Cytophagales bacterium]|jgi:hypothetical protein|nr:hypothetical protein [Cytophagales bacterium]
MNKKLAFTFTLALITQSVFSQMYFPPRTMPEHGFLPGKKFQYYSTINKHDLKQARFRVEVYDDRAKLGLSKTECSDINFTNTSEFEAPECIYKLGKYVDTLFKQSNAINDINSNDTLQIRLQGIDARLIGFGYSRVHGLCQIEVKYHNQKKVYCIDITDADKNSPVGPTAFVTRKTATRIMASAAMREVIEKLITDLENCPTF